MQYIYKRKFKFGNFNHFDEVSYADPYGMNRFNQYVRVSVPTFAHANSYSTTTSSTNSHTHTIGIQPEVIVNGQRYVPASPQPTVMVFRISKDEVIDRDINGLRETHHAIYEFVNFE